MMELVEGRGRGSGLMRVRGGNLFSSCLKIGFGKGLNFLVQAGFGAVYCSVSFEYFEEFCDFSVG